MTAALTREQYLETIRVEAGRLARLDPEHLLLPLPHIDAWTVHDVVGHTGWVHRWVTLTVAAPPDSPPQRSAVPEPPAGAEVLEWFAEASAGLLESLERLDPDADVATFIGPQKASWWCRRLAHETSMHRWDAESAFTTPEPLDADLARDGIEELFEVFVPNRMQWDALAGKGETIHLHATDAADGEWVLTLGTDSIACKRAHAKSDVAARGAMADLLLLLWSRLPPSRLEVFGDAGLLDRWQEAARF